MSAPKRPLLLLATAVFLFQGVHGEGVLPEGDRGIAARYVEDKGIEGDQAVIFFDGFEGYASPRGLSRRWDSVHHLDQIRIVGEKEGVFAGKQALEFRVPKRNRELSNTVAKDLPQECEVLFLRYYSKFDPSFDVTGSSHNGCSVSAGYFRDGRATAGIPADGKNKFLIAFENWRGKEDPAQANPGRYNIYIYHPAQRSKWGDHFFPTGIVLPNSSRRFDFGPNFVRRPDVTPKRGRWYCHEVMLRANTVGKKDGRIACWIDGKLIADFQNLRLRDIDSLKIDRFALNLHIGRNTRAATKKWYDNIVAATSYIGPMKRKAP